VIARLVDPSLVTSATQRRDAISEDDAALVARACAGDRWAEDAIYRRHARFITRVCTRLLGRQDDADDVVQDTFLVAFDKLETLTEPNSLRAWLARIAVQKARRRLRKRRILWLCGMGQPEGDTALILRARDGARPDLQVEIQAVSRALAEQPPEHRAAWLLHRLEALSIQETAEVTGKSTATVKRYVAAVDAHIERACGCGYE
jgi:RNA polymerase sigma-70 factor (ECF subfamily)